MVNNSEVREYLREQIEELATNISLDHFTDKIKWAQANVDYGRTACVLAETEHGTESYELYEKAIEAFRSALKVYKTKTHIKNRCKTTIALCKTLRFYGTQKGGAYGESCLRQALNLLQKLSEALKAPELYRNLVDLKCEEASIYRSLSQISASNDRLNCLEHASTSLMQAAKILQQKEDFTDWAYILLIHGHVYIELSKLQNIEAARDSLESAAALFEAVIESAKHRSYTAGPLIQEAEYINAAFELGCTYIKLADSYSNDKYITYMLKALAAFSLINDAMLAQLEDKVKIDLYQKKATILRTLAKVKTENSEALRFLWRAISLHEQSLTSLPAQARRNYNIAIIYNLANDLKSCALISSLNDRKCHLTTALTSLRKARQDAYIVGEAEICAKLSTALADILEHIAVLEQEKPRATELLIDASEIYKKLLKDFPQHKKNKLLIYNKLAGIYGNLSNLQNKPALARQYLKKTILYLYRATKLNPAAPALTLTLAKEIIKLADITKAPKKYRAIIEQTLNKIINNSEIKPFWHRKAKVLAAEFYYIDHIYAKPLEKIAYLKHCYNLYYEIAGVSEKTKKLKHELTRLYKKHWLRLLFVKK